MRVAISYIQGAYLRDYERDYVPSFSRELLQSPSPSGITLVQDPRQADFIILWEGFEYKTPAYITTLESDPLIRHHADRVYTINYDDHPEGFLAGVYTSLEAPFFDPKVHAIWPFYTMNNPRVYDLSRADVMAYAPSKLFSFRGAASHPVRERLFSLYPVPTPDYHVEHVKRWYDHGDDDRLKFARLALDSVFCLCPHGYCSYTPRITEVMAMARVPVVIADDWIPFSFPDNIPYYIRIPEDRIEDLPALLKERTAEAEQLRLNARSLWERYLSPETRAASLAGSIARLATRPGGRPSYEDYRAKWHSSQFLKSLGWTAPQRFALRIEQHLRRRFPKACVPGVSPLMRYRNAPNLK